MITSVEHSSVIQNQSGNWLLIIQEPETAKVAIDLCGASRVEANGFSNRSAKVAASLPYTSGAMLSAAREALDNGCGAIAA